MSNQASLESLVFLLHTQAVMQLGINPFGEEKAEPQPQIAQHFIDLIAMLQEKTKGNVTMEEQRLLENTLTELRFRYVQAIDELKKKPTEQNG